MSANKIIIDINEANKAQKYSKEGLFQIDSFNKVEEILKEHSVGKYNKNIVDCRFHDTIFIDGDRGVGKTAFMLNIKAFYEDKKDNKKYLFLDPVDPTLLENTEKFLSVVLARVVERVSDDIDKKDEDKSHKYFEALSNLSKSLSAIKTLSGDIGIEEIASNKSSLKLEQYAHEFFQVVSEMYEVKGIVILIDDIDMAFEKGFDVLEVVRKYLASPYLIPIVAGDMKLYKEIVETQFMKKIGFHDDVKYLQSICSKDVPLKDSEEYKTKRELLDNLVEQYLHKLFPSEYHIQLQDIFTILKTYEVEIKLDNNLVVKYNDLKDFEIRLINYGINQKEFTQRIFTNNTRDFVQYIYNKKDIFKYAFESFTIPYNDKVESFLVSDRFDEMIRENFIKKQEKHKKSLQLTADFYRYSVDVDKKRLSLLLDNDVNAFTDKGYSIHKALQGDFFMKEEKPFNKIDKEVVRNKLDFPKYFTQYKTIIEDLKENYSKEYTIFDLMLHKDYYTNTNTKHLFITGKFIEFIVCLFDNTIEDRFKVVNNISNIIFSEISKNNYIKFYSTENEEEIDNSEHIGLLEDKFDNIFSNQNLPKGTPFISSVFLYEILKKYMNNLNIFKVGEHSTEVEDKNKFNDEYNKLYREVPYFDNMQKVLYILLNSIAYFELNDKPSKENIALGKDIKNINKSRTYNINIRKIIEKRDDYMSSLTLFIYDIFESSLGSLEKNSLFINTYEELTDINKKLKKRLKEYGWNFSKKIMLDEDKEKVIDNIMKDIENLDTDLRRGILEYPRFKDNFIYYVYKKKPKVKDKATKLKEILEEENLSIIEE